jgi:multidrug resistance efflux pump
VEAMNQQLADLRSQMEAEVATLQATYDPAQEKLETITLRPKKTGIVVKAMFVRAEAAEALCECSRLE